MDEFSGDWGISVMVVCVVFTVYVLVLLLFTSGRDPGIAIYTCPPTNYDMSANQLKQTYGLKLWQSLVRETELTAQLCSIMRDVKNVKGGTHKKIEKLRHNLLMCLFMIYRLKKTPCLECWKVEKDNKFGI